MICFGLSDAFSLFVGSLKKALVPLRTIIGKIKVVNNVSLILSLSIFKLVLWLRCASICVCFFCRFFTELFDVKIPLNHFEMSNR